MPGGRQIHDLDGVRTVGVVDRSGYLAAVADIREEAIGAAPLVYPSADRYEPHARATLEILEIERKRRRAGRATRGLFPS